MQARGVFACVIVKVAGCDKDSFPSFLSRNCTDKTLNFRATDLGLPAFCLDLDDLKPEPTFFNQTVRYLYRLCVELLARPPSSIRNNPFSEGDRGRLVRNGTDRWTRALIAVRW